MNKDEQINNMYERLVDLGLTNNELNQKIKKLTKEKEELYLLLIKLKESCQEKRK